MGSPVTQRRGPAAGSMGGDGGGACRRVRVVRAGPGAEATALAIPLSLPHGHAPRPPGRSLGPIQSRTGIWAAGQGGLCPMRPVCSDQSLLSGLPQSGGSLADVWAEPPLLCDPPAPLAALRGSRGRC